MSRNWLVVLAVGGSLAAAAELSEKFSKRIDSAEAAYQQAVAKADNTRFYAVQKANSDRVKSLKQALTDATKAGDFDAAMAIKERLTEAEKSGPKDKPKDTVKFGGHDYAICKDTLTWHQAKERCQEMGGHLVTFENQGEQSFVLDYCRRSKVDVWLGATNETELRWTWLSGAAVKIDPTWTMDDPYKNLFSGALTYWKDSDTFNDHNLGAHIGYLCEWDS